MKVTEPKVYLVAKPQLSWPGYGDFVVKELGLESIDNNPTSTAEHLCEVAGRLCYMSYNKPRPGGNEAYLKHILESGHGSVTEHAVWGFIITGVSRSFTHELVRHRHFSFSQLSQRFVDESDARFVCPEMIAQDETLQQIWQRSIESSQSAYAVLVAKIQERYPDRKIKQIREAARSVLPNATETKIYVTANARALRSFLEQRCTRHADVEMRKVAYAIYELLLQEAPHLFGDYEKIALEDDTWELTTPYKKV